MFVANRSVLVGNISKDYMDAFRAMKFRPDTKTFHFFFSSFSPSPKTIERAWVS